MASTPATTTEPASFATSVATRPTRAIGAGIRDVLCRPALVFFVTSRAPDDDLPAAALRLDAALPLALRLALVVERPLLADADGGPEEALRDLLDAPAAAADLPRDFALFVLFLLALREALLPDFPRDFLALVAIDASPRSR